MPDTRSDPKAIQLRDAMENALPHTFERASKANQLLEQVLGGPGERRADVRYDAAVPEALQTLVSWYTQRFPKAGASVRGVFPLSPQEVASGAAGMFGRLGGGMKLDPALKPSDQRAVILHEMGHGVGLEDSPRGRDVGAYSLSDAADWSRQDINLPVDAEAVRRALLTRMQK